MRSGKHKARSDEKDFKILTENLEKLNAHTVVDGRLMGEIKYTENFLKGDVINWASFYRWITKRNKEFATSFKAFEGDQAFPVV